ncbi:EAL domain-containing protein [Pseudomonas veronii]|nr:hypothetical protein C1Y30_07470 [Pseudomonas sp. GW704-F3]PMU97767.1 hypothetical protein C1Y28_00995 [Pseudomonas sp. GW704-F5]PMV08861.1 hypothetical protein C1Y29_00915 [Pseudomonas sp. MPBD4-3]PMV35840.1 hypothetical protein C1Y27_02770 [Pseudomonas sp. GW704-F2]RTY70925.1 EAL domain-containing protein [Pseudomonas veronii]
MPARSTGFRRGNPAIVQQQSGNATGGSCSDRAGDVGKMLIAQQLQHCGLQPANLCVEVTEGVLLSDSLGAEQAIRDLHALGIRLAIDDFGTGYSSLGYLRHLPISELNA